MSYAIEIRNATKDYGRGRGVFDLSLTVAPGEVVGFLGANGAGKSVTMRLLMGFVRPRVGSVRIFGRDCFSQRAEIQQSVGYLPGELAFPGDMTGLSFLRFAASMANARGNGGRLGCKRADELAEFFELDPSVPLRSMSKGTRQKVGIVAAFMTKPRLLLLDEPTRPADAKALCGAGAGGEASRRHHHALLPFAGGSGGHLRPGRFHPAGAAGLHRICR